VVPALRASLTSAHSLVAACSSCGLCTGCKEACGTSFPAGASPARLPDAARCSQMQRAQCGQQQCVRAAHGCLQRV